MIHTCPNHEISKEFIIQFFDARLSHDDQTLLNACVVGSYMKETIEFSWDLLEKIKHNTEDWELDEGKESGIKLDFDCVKSFMETYTFHDFCNKYGLDSETVATFCESFPTYVDLPKEKWIKYHPPIEKLLEESIKIKKEEIIVSHVDSIVPTSYIEKPPFPVKIREHAKATIVVNKSYVRTPKASEQKNIEPNVAIVNDVLVDNIGGQVIYLCDQAARITKPVRNKRDELDKSKLMVGTHVISVKIRDHCYHGLCDIGSSISAIPFTLY